jgi:NAD(P)-dependent dehydrogenase (short-subunit alcohol dehydrogenase family)
VHGAGIAVITGASRGIGRVLALHLAANGLSVAALARPSGDLDSLVDAPGEIVPIPADVTDPAAVRAAFDTVTARLRPPSIVITAAGSIDALGPVVDADPDRWWSSIEVDLRGTMLTVHAALQTMLYEGRGRIITMYGNLGDRGTPNLSAFAAAKAAVARFTESLAAELAGTGVVALCMHPGFVRTPMTERLAWGDDGREWLPEFGLRAEGNWGDGRAAVLLVDQILAGAADGLPGRIVHAGDDLVAVALQASGSEDVRRLRIGGS